MSSRRNNPPAIRSQEEFFRTGVTPTTAAQQDPCPICLDEITRDGVQILACRHSFHRACLQTWLQGTDEDGGRPNRTCPNCRAQLFESDARAPAAPSRFGGPAIGYPPYGYEDEDEEEDFGYAFGRMTLEDDAGLFGGYHGRAQSPPPGLFGGYHGRAQSPHLSRFRG